MEEKWDVCPTHWKKNFECILVDTGKWGPESKELGYSLLGKWLFLTKPIGQNSCPSFADQRNFLTGLLEAEFRNDSFVFPNGTTRPSQYVKTTEKISNVIEDVKNRERSKVKLGMDYYIKRWENGES